MPEWLYEAGIGECRAALVQDGKIIEAVIEIDGGLRVGHVARARLIGPGLVRLDSGEEAQLAGAPGVPQGGALTVRIVREAMPEPGRAKPPRAVVTDEAPQPGPHLLARLGGVPVRQVAAHGPDLLEEAGWSELLEEARTGDIAFAGGALRMWVTPAMTLFDVDGTGPLELLAVAAAEAVAKAIRCHGIGGSIGIDFPTLAGKAPRQAVAAAIDRHLSQPFERTAVNGFGFLQIVRPRFRASLPEQLHADPLGHAARALLRRLEREPPGGQPVHRLSPALLARMTPAWQADLTRRTGVAYRFESDR